MMRRSLEIKRAVGIPYQLIIEPNSPIVLRTIMSDFVETNTNDDGIDVEVQRSAYQHRVQCPSRSQWLLKFLNSRRCSD